MSSDLISLQKWCRDASDLKADNTHTTKALLFAIVTHVEEK